MHLEFSYGESLHRWIDLASKSGYDVKTDACKLIVDKKLQIVIKCRNYWPMHCSIDEDIKFRKEIWNLHFPPEKMQWLIFHDNANVRLKELSDASQHKSTRSEYYKQCCAKGGDASQPCGWNRGLHLVTGACPDSLCISMVRMLEQQKVFQEHCSDANQPARKFLNIFDKGYRLSLEAAKLDQACLQPHFAKSDSQFSRHELISSGAIAYLRSGNERNVKQMKRSRILRQGVASANFNLERLDNIWMAWGFQVNFMCRPCM